MSAIEDLTDVTTMRAAVQHAFGPPDVLRLDRVPRPVPVPTEVLVRVHAAGVNPVDWKTREGKGMSALLGEAPHVPGWDVSGVVEEVGFGVTTLAPGDEVYGMPWFPRPARAYAEYVTAPSRQLARKPERLTHEQAAAAPLAALTAWQALVDTADVRAGQRVLVTAAAGGVGHLAVQFARHLGAHVVAVASARHHDWLRSLGVDGLVDYTAVRFEEEVADVDVAVDLVGDGLDATGSRAVQTVRPGGQLVAVAGGTFAAQLHAVAEPRGVRVRPFLVEPDGAALARVAQLVDAGEVAVEVAEVLSLEQAGEAHARGAAGRTRGKLVLRVAD